MIRHAVYDPNGAEIFPETARAVTRTWKSSLHGVEYTFVYFRSPGPAHVSLRNHYRVKGKGWTITFSSVPDRDDAVPRGLDWVSICLVSSSKRRCVNFKVGGDMARYKKDMTMIRMFED